MKVFFIVLCFILGQPLFSQNNIPENNNSRFPVYRGCDKTSNNEELEKCSKRKIMNFIKMSFDSEMASRVMPTERSTKFL